MKESEAGLVEQLASGGWTRLRNLLGALDRIDRLETSTEFVGWLNGLLADEPGLRQLIREFQLRALRLASDPVNSLILVRLTESGPATTHDLMEAAGLKRVELVERINELARAGLTMQALEGDKVEATPFARGFVALVDEITSQVMTLAVDDYLLTQSMSPSPISPGRGKIRYPKPDS